MASQPFAMDLTVDGDQSDVFDSDAVSSAQTERYHEPSQYSAFLPLQTMNEKSTRHQRPRFLTLTSPLGSPPPLPAMTTSSTSPPIPVLAPTVRRAPPFLRLPAEIRLQIYALLVLPHDPAYLRPSFVKVNSSAQHYYDYANQEYGTDRAPSEHTLMIRTIDPTTYSGRHGYLPQHARKSYVMRADRFRARCMTTTYHCVNNPRIEDNLAIMRASKQVHAEVAELLYGHYTFDFDSHVEAIVPFFSDLTSYARGCVKSVRFVKRALPYDKEFDKCEWSNAMRYLTCAGNNIRLRRLQLGVVAGRPGLSGWDRVPKYSAMDFGILHQMDGNEWMQYLLEFSGLESLDVQAVLEHCPPGSTSSAMANYVRFSASVESGFTDFLRSKLLARPHDILACRL